MKTLNFDKFMAEKEKDYITVTVFGKSYEVEKRIPAIVPVLMARAERSRSTEEKTSLYTKMVMQSADTFFGKDVVEEFCEKGMAVEELSDLVSRLFSAISGKEEVEQEELADDAGFVAKEETEKKSR